MQWTFYGATPSKQKGNKLQQAKSTKQEKKSQAKVSLSQLPLKRKALYFERILLYRFLPQFPRFLACKEFFAPPVETRLSVNQPGLIFRPV